MTIRTLPPEIIIPTARLFTDAEAVILSRAVTTFVTDEIPSVDLRGWQTREWIIHDLADAQPGDAQQAFNTLLSGGFLIGGLAANVKPAAHWSTPHYRASRAGLAMFGFYYKDGRW